jgi:NTP pyrophosphatase (non-canonical NTP hydrolase)
MNDAMKELDEKTLQTLLITQEECAEVTQAISKVFRFGMGAQYPVGAATNKQRLEEELGDLQAMIDILCYKKIVDVDKLNQASKNKLEKLKHWANVL